MVLTQEWAREWANDGIVVNAMHPGWADTPGVRMTFKGRVDDMLLVKGVNVFPNAVRDVVNRYGDITTGNIRLLLPQTGPVIEPPIIVLVETQTGLDEAAQKTACKEIEAAIHHQIRFRAQVILQPVGKFEVQTGATGKSKLFEVNAVRPLLALEWRM